MLAFVSGTLAVNVPPAVRSLDPSVIGPATSPWGGSPVARTRNGADAPEEPPIALSVTLTVSSPGRDGVIVKVAVPLSNATVEGTVVPGSPLTETWIVSMPLYVLVAPDGSLRVSVTS